MGTKGHPGIYLLAAVFASAGFGASAATGDETAQAASYPCTLSAPEIAKKIKEHGARAMLLGLPGSGTDYSGFDELIDCIWGGKKEWVDIAVPVITEARPDTEDVLTDAVQNALVVNPEVVLSEPWPSFFTVRDYICSVSTDDLSASHIDNLISYQDAMAKLNGRMEVIKKITRPELKNKVTACLAGFDETKRNLASLYQIDKPSDYVSPQPAPNSGTAPPAPDPGTAPPPPDPSTAPPSPIMY